MSTSAISVIGINCPQCGKPMDGFGEDVLFTCSVCGHAVDPAQDPPKPMAIAYVAPDKSMSDTVNLYLPFWLIPIQPHAADADGNQIHLDGWLEHIWVTAFATQVTVRYGEPAVSLTIAKAKPEAKGEKGRMAGIVRTVEQAKTIARYFQLAQLDSRQDLKDHIVEPQFGKTYLCAAPFHFDKNRYEMKDLLIGKTYSAKILRNAHGLLP